MTGMTRELGLPNRESVAFGWEGEGVFSSESGLTRRNPSESLLFHFFSLLSLGKVLVLEGDTKGERESKMG